MSESDGTWPHVYIEKIAQMVWMETLPEGEECNCWPYGEGALWLGYALLVLAKGEETTSRDVHDAWSAWSVQYHDYPHRSAIPFEELEGGVQAYDNEYRDAIHRVARKLACQ